MIIMLYYFVIQLVIERKEQRIYQFQKHIIPTFWSC